MRLLLLLSAIALLGSPTALADVATLPAEAIVAAPVRHMVISGGGKVTDEMRRALIEGFESAGKRVLIVPQAHRRGDDAAHAERQAGHFRRLGASEVEVLDLSDPEAARAQINRADAFWIPGGSQLQLMQVLDAAGVTNLIRARIAAGAVAGGSSAGAAVMAETMLTNSRRRDGMENPVLGRGLGCWPEVIVDPHFSQRRRIPRLTEALRRHPHLIGVGIDEDTAVVTDGRTLRVLGDYTVTIMRQPADKPDSTDFERVVLRAGDHYVLPVGAR